MSDGKKPGFFQRLFGTGSDQLKPAEPPSDTPKREPPAKAPAKQEPPKDSPVKKDPPERKRPAQGGHR